MPKSGRKLAGMTRVMVVTLVIAAQLLVLTLVVTMLRTDALWLYGLLEVIGIFVIIGIINRHQNDSYSLTWVVIILLLPIFGYLLYFMWGSPSLNSWRTSNIRRILSRIPQDPEQDPQLFEQFSREHPYRQRMGRFLLNNNFPLFSHTDCVYFPSGEMQFENMLADLEKAQRFIFMEYFIVSEGKLWDQIQEILVRKATQGVDVRLLYDDLGSIIAAPTNLDRILNNQNVKAARFNPVQREILRLFLNYRNHQKITVIDGNVGYTGGCNIGDEYVNLYPRYGYWKDSAIRLEGDAVLGLTLAFLRMWESESRTREDYTPFFPASSPERKGYFQPFTDGPTNNPNNPAETMYHQIIAGACDYVYMTTPYLIIDPDMRNVLITAARSGVDVRIITPQHWDHWYVRIVSIANYGPLLKAGVRVFEYRPGMMHAKNIISDDDCAIVGTINMDYRSFNLHFENGVWICGAPVLADIKKDLVDTFDECQEITLAEWEARPGHMKVVEAVMRLFSPLM